VRGKRENPKKEIGTTTKNTSTVEPISDVLSAVSSTYGKNNNDALSREIREDGGEGIFGALILGHDDICNHNPRTPWFQSRQLTSVIGCH
jgi:hypothetical protein